LLPYSLAKMFHFFGMSKPCGFWEKGQAIIHVIYERFLSGFMRTRGAYY